MENKAKASSDSFDFSERPFLVIWETTHACDPACRHCRAGAEPDPFPDELSHDEAKDLIAQVKALGTPIFIFSGGDPLKRKDLPGLVRYAKSLGLRTGAIPAGSPLLTEERVRELKAAGLDQMALSLDSASQAIHDDFRQSEGVFARTLRAADWAHACGLAVQINSLINIEDLKEMDGLIALVQSLGIVFWEVFFLVPTGRGKELPLMPAQKFEEAFDKLYRTAQQESFFVKITEVPHFRRFCIEKEMKKNGIDPEKARCSCADLPKFMRRTAGPQGSVGRAPQGVNAGKGFVFVSCQGEVLPSGFLPLSGGNIRNEKLGSIYRDSSLFKSLRNPELLKGRCGICRYKEICGGSRSRDYAMTGDYLEEDPCCDYQPSAAEAKERVPAEKGIELR